MVKKIIETCKTMMLVLICIMVPLLIAMSFLRSAAKEDATKCVDSFIVDEAVGLAKYIGLQFENTPMQIDSICRKVQKRISDDIANTQKSLRQFVKKNSTISSISIYDERGKLFASSSDDDSGDIDIDNEKYKNIEKNIVYHLDQVEDSNEVVIKYIVKKNIGTNDNKKEMFFEVSMKWSKYENYLKQLPQGSFPRMFYIISPDCTRYVSMNALPAARIKASNAAALGLHLVKQHTSIKEGLSKAKVASFPFKIYKASVKMPKRLIGNSFCVVVAADEFTVDEMLEQLLNRVPIIILILGIVLLLVCLVLARFYNKTTEQLEISTAISSNTPLAISIFRISDGKIIQINAAALTLFRIEKEKTDTINLWNLFLYEDDKHYIENAISSKVNVLNYEVLLQSFSGGSFWAICSASPIEVNEEVCVILATLDINRRKEVEKKLANNAALLETQIKERTADLEKQTKQLEESNALLEKSRAIADEANAAKTKFLANMSNELKTPINAIIGYSEILEEEALDRKDTVTADDLRKIISSAKHLLSLIDEILDLSSIESGKTQLFFENIDVGTLVKDVESVTMPLITSNDNSLFIETKKDIGSMYTDATKLRQCLLNLLSNAAKFTQFGKVTLRVVSVVKEGIDFVEFSVIDTGVGIESDKIDTIFDSFQDTKSKNSGAGLGLSVTKKYVEVLGGTIKVESEIGVGSKFTIRVPRKAEITSSDTVVVKNQQNIENEIIEEEADSSNSNSNATDGYSLSSNSNNSSGNPF